MIISGGMIRIPRLRMQVLDVPGVALYCNLGLNKVHHVCPFALLSKTMFDGIREIGR